MYTCVCTHTYTQTHVHNMHTNEHIHSLLHSQFIKENFATAKRALLGLELTGKSAPQAIGMYI